MTDKHLKCIEKLAEGYYYEEVTKSVEESNRGTVKNVITTKKHIPPNLDAIMLLNRLNKSSSSNAKSLDDLEKEVRKLNEN